MLSEAAKEKRFAALQDAIKDLEPQLPPRLRDEILGLYIFDSHMVKGVY